jgi:hypothetical protein
VLRVPDLTLLIRRRKGLLLAVVLLSVGLAYVALAIGLGIDPAGHEHRFGQERHDDQRQLRVYIEPVAVDPVNESLRLRVHFSPSPALAGRQPDVADRDLTVLLTEGDHRQQLIIPAQQAIPLTTFEADLKDGTVASYPLDRFRAGLWLSATDTAGEAIPLQVTAWDGVAGWTLRVAQTYGANEGGVELRLTLRRSPALRLLVLAIYGEMVLIGSAALTIGSVTALAEKAPESTLMGALTGMIFALPVLRYALPGLPPLGVRADILVFFLAEMAVALGLVLFIVTWARARMRK